MEVILAVVRPKQTVSGQDYKPKSCDILLLDHKNNERNGGKPTKYFPSLLLNIEDEPKDKILAYLYTITSGEHGGIKGERVLAVPMQQKESHRSSTSTSRFSMYFIPVSTRDKLTGILGDKSPFVPCFYSLDSLLHSGVSSMSFSQRTKTFLMHVDNWLREKHSKLGSLDLIFCSKADLRVKMVVSNPVFLPFSLGLSDSGSCQSDLPEEIQITANGVFAKMMRIEKCAKVVLNPLFGTGLTARSGSRRTSMCEPCPDYIESGTTSRKSSLNSSIDPESYSPGKREQYPLHFYASKGDVLQIQNCLSRSYYVAEQDLQHWTALHFAAWYGYQDVVQILLTAGCSPNVVNSDDRTPLHLAAIKGYPAVVKVLLRHPEIDMNVVDKKGRTALDMCEQKLSYEHIQVAKILEMSARQTRPIQVQMMDGSTKSLNLVDGANTTVQQLNQQMLHEFNMPETPYADIFTIWICSPSLELQLKPEHKPLEHMNNWKRRIVSMLTDGDPKEEEPHLKWRRNAKISLIVERVVIHPVAINLLFHEARQNYINAFYPCKEQDILRFASLLLFMNHTENDQPITKAFFTKEVLQQLVPAPNLKSKSNWPSRILHMYKLLCQTEHNDSVVHSPQALQYQFLNSCRNLTVYGSAFFRGTLQDSRQMAKCFIAVNDVGLHIINIQTRVMLHSYKYSEISWLLPAEYGVLEVNIVRNDFRQDRHGHRNTLKLQTKQAGMINHLMKKLSRITYGIISPQSINVE